MQQQDIDQTPRRIEPEALHFLEKSWSDLLKDKPTGKSVLLEEYQRNRSDQASPKKPYLAWVEENK